MIAVRTPVEWVLFRLGRAAAEEEHAVDLGDWMLVPRCGEIPASPTHTSRRANRSGIVQLHPVAIIPAILRTADPIRHGIIFRTSTNIILDSTIQSITASRSLVFQDLFGRRLPVVEFDVLKCPVIERC